MAKQPLELIHMDLVGLLPNESFSKSRYFESLPMIFKEKLDLFFENQGLDI